MIVASAVGEYGRLVWSYPSWRGGAVIAGKTALIYLFLVIGLRLLGRRTLGQLNIYDLIVIIVLANAVQNAMVGNDTTLVGGLVAATTLVILNRAAAGLVARSSRLEHMMVGDPIVLVTDGKPVPANLRREGVTQAELMEALREHELDDLRSVRLCILEADGTISVVPQQASVRRTRRHYRGLRLG
jgi:uncharacterized membrane protein YcaP (DUF421 family)